MECSLVFTGLVEDLGHIVGLVPRGNGVELTIRTRLPLAEVEIGDSIAVNGVCLTVERCDGDCFVATAGRETMDKLGSPKFTRWRDWRNINSIFVPTQNQSISMPLWR